MSFLLLQRNVTSLVSSSYIDLTIIISSFLYIRVAWLVKMMRMLLFLFTWHGQIGISECQVLNYGRQWDGKERVPHMENT